MSEDVCAARIETLRGWAEAGVNGRIEHDVVRRVGAVERDWDACLAACEFRDVDGNPGPELAATMDQFRTNEAWVRGIATALEDAPIVEGIAQASSSEVAAAIDGSGVAPDTTAIEYDALEVTGLPVTSGLVNDPVNAANGNFVHADRDVATPGFGAVLDVVRTYNSLAALQAAVPTGRFGTGWTSPLDVALDLDGADAGIVRLLFTDGALVTFRSTVGADAADPNAATEPAAGSRAWQPNTRRSLELLEGGPGNPDGWTVLRDHGRRRFHFDHDGRLIGGSELAAAYRVTWGDDEIVVAEDRSARHVRYLLHDNTGRVTEAISSDGRRCRYRYDPEGRCTAVERAIGDLTYTYDERGFLVSSTDGDGVAAFVNTYDAAGRVTAQVAPHGRRTRFEYLDNGGTRITDADPDPSAEGDSNLLFHDRQGNLTAMFGSDGVAMRAAYDDRGRPVRHVDRAGAVTRYHYADDTSDLVARRTDPDGLAEERDYDARGRLLTQHDRAGAVHRFSYEGENPHPVRIEGPDGTGVATVYDDRWLPVTVTDADGIVTTFDWDRDGQLVACVNGAGERTTITYDETGQLTGVVEPDGRATTIELDDAHRVLATISVGGVEQRFSYTAAGRVSSMMSPAPGSWTAEYGPHGDVIAVTDATGATVGFTHDHAGRISAMTAPDGAVTTQVWDGLGQLRSVTDPAGATTTQTYDRAGRSIAVTLPDGRAHRRAVDELGRTITLVEPDGATWHRTYHPNGRLASVTDPSGAVWRFEIDGVGRVSAEIGPDGGRRTFDYSPGSRLLTETTPAGRTITTSYDAAGRPMAATDADGVTTTTITTVAADRADGSGEPFSAGHSGAAVVGSGPDRVTFARGEDQPAVFGFDPRQLLAEVAEPSGVATRITRDIRGRLTGTSTAGPSSTVVPCVTSVEYDASGAVARTVDGSGAVTTYRHSAAGLLDAILFGGAGDDDGGPSLGIAFTRDDAGRPTQIAALDRTLLATFDYDPCGRLTEASSGPVISSLERDVRGFVTATVSGDDGSTRYERDRDGLVAATVDPAGRRTDFARTPAGRLQGFVDDEAGEVALPPSSSPGEERDAAGRLTVDRHGRRYHYDLAGRIDEAVSLTGERWAYTYNDLGLLATDTRTSASGSTRRRTFGYDPGGRLEQVRHGDGGATRFTYDVAGRRTGELDPEGRTVTYTWDQLDRLLAVTTTSADGETRTRRFTYDGLGHVVAVDDVSIGWDPVITNKPVRIADERYLRSGTAVRLAQPDTRWFDGTYDDPYGSSDHHDGVRLGYRGELTVDGLVFMGDRVYDPTTRAFLSKDPLPPRPGTNGSFASPYLYAWSDPVNYLDPTGREPVSIEEFQAWKDRQENNRFQRAGQAIVDDPWGSLAMATVVVGGTVLLATPFAPVGAGILIGAASSAAMGLATDNFNPRSVAISGAFGAVPGGTSVRTAFALGAAENVATQVLVDGRGLTEINLGEAIVDGTFSGAMRYLSTGGGTNNVVPDGPTSDMVEIAPGSAADDLVRVGSRPPFVSTDPYVADVANSIEARYPGHVIDVNVPAFRPDGSLATDFDIELRNSIIQVKGGSGTGAGRQITETINAPPTAGRPVILYGPNLGPHVIREAERRGGLATRNLDDLIDVVAP